MKKILACLLAVIMFSGPVLAQSDFQSLKRNSSAQNDDVVVMPIPRPRPVPVPQMIVSPDRKPITLQDLKIDVEVIGNLAMTTYEMTFHNQNQVIMEGEFVLPLAQNQNVSAIALDINGKMRDGVVVEKQKARQTFESIVRRGVDPALVEKTAGNQFKTRIYPFNPNGTRRIRVTIEEPLETKGGGYIYNLPLEFNQSVNFAINLELPINAKEGKHKFDKDIPFKFEKVQTVLKASFSKNEWFLDNSVSFFIPRDKESTVFTHKEGNETFFYTDINVKAASKNKTLPKKIAVVWDSSLSSSKRDLKREFALMDAYFAKLSNVEVTFVTFNIKTDINKKFTVKNGEWSALKKEIEELIYDGATRFDGLNLNKLNADEILLFSDGVSTFGNTQITESETPVFVVNSSTEFNRGGLVNASVKSGGSFINLNGSSNEEALTLLTKQNLKLVSYSFSNNKIGEVYPKAGVDVGENFTFAGILSAGEGEVTLNFGYGKKDIAVTKKIKVKAGGDNQAVARLWAVQKIKDLEMDTEKNEKEILKLGQEYSVVTDFTSLLVLENLQDYVTYKIVPPQELLAEYNRLMSNIAKGEDQKEKSALDNSISQAREIKEWWKKEYDQSKPAQIFKKLKESFSGSRQSEAGYSVSESAVTERNDVVMQESVALSAPVPAAAAAPRREEARRMERSRVSSGVSANKSLDSMEMASADMMVASGISADKEAGWFNGKMDDSKAYVAKQTASVQVKAWDPQTPYMKILKKSKDDELYKDYLKLKDGYNDQPSFYFDITDEFMRRKMNDKAVVILSNIAEMKLDNPELLRTVANKLMELGEYGYAVDMFEKIVKLRGEDPQSYRDLALAYQANKEYQKSLDTFYKILCGSWNRFDSVKQIIFVEMNNLIALSPKLDTSKINKELIFAMPVDVRVVLGWSTDNTDIDIHVKDPYNEEAYYGNRFTKIGGRVSVDLTQGFGPEEFMLKKAVNGNYEIFTNNFGDSRQSISGPTVLYLDIFTFYGTKKQTHQRVLVRTENVKQNNVIGTVNFENK